MIYRVSNVERFRQWERDEDADLEGLLADLRGESLPSAAMLAGTAFHKCLELFSEEVPLVEALSIDGYRFTFDGDFDLELAPVRELRASKTYTVDDEPITISGQVDGLAGKRIDDHKTTGRFDPERYVQGFQWRLYLDIFGAQQFRWNVFEIEEIAAEFGSGEQTFAVTAAHRLEQYRYPGMGEDCQSLVERFARFVREHLERPPIGGKGAQGEVYRVEDHA